MCGARVRNNVIDRWGIGEGGGCNAVGPACNEAGNVEGRPPERAAIGRDDGDANPNDVGTCDRCARGRAGRGQPSLVASELALLFILAGRATLLATS